MFPAQSHTSSSLLRHSLQQILGSRQIRLFILIMALVNVAQAISPAAFDDAPAASQKSALNFFAAPANSRFQITSMVAMGNLGQTETIANGTYKIIAKHSGKALSVSDSSLTNGANINQWDYINGNNQKWLVESVGDGTYKLTAANSEKVLDVSDFSQQNGALVHQWSYVGGDNQKWRIEPVGNGYYRLIANHSGKALDVTGASSSNGAGIIQWDYTGGDNQLWQFNLMTLESQSPFVPAHYQLMFNDEFGQEELNTSQWFTRYIYADGYQDYLNDEQERY